MFQELFSMLNDGQLLTINLLRQGEKFVVSVFPQSPHVRDNAKSIIVPLNLKGSPAELEEGFIPAITVPVQRASGILMNMAQYEEKAEKAASDSKALKEKTEKINKAIKEAESLEAEKPGAALLAYKKILEQDKYNSKVTGKIKSLEKKVSEGSLFGAEEVMPAVESPVKAAGTPVNPSENRKPGTEGEVAAGVPATPAFASQPAHTTGTQPSVDMFLQAVNAAGEPSGGDPDKVNAVPAFDPAVFSQFQQFMAMQEAAKQPNNNELNINLIK